MESCARSTASAMRRRSCWNMCASSWPRLGAAGSAKLAVWANACRDCGSLLTARRVRPSCQFVCTTKRGATKTVLERARHPLKARSSAPRKPMHDTPDQVHWHEPKAGENAGYGKFKRAPMPYDRFMEAEGVPVYRGIGVRRVQDLPLAPWKRLGGRRPPIPLLRPP